MMSSFFQRLTGDDDPDLLSLCFVETPESRHADMRLAKIAEDIVGRISALDTKGTALSTVIKRVQESKRHEFVLIVGTKGWQEHLHLSLLRHCLAACHCGELHGRKG
jgi:hypothetical protein